MIRVSRMATALGSAALLLCGQASAQSIPPTAPPTPPANIGPAMVAAARAMMPTQPSPYLWPTGVLAYEIVGLDLAGSLDSYSTFVRTEDNAFGVYNCRTDGVAVPNPSRTVSITAKIMISAESSQSTTDTSSVSVAGDFSGVNPGLAATIERSQTTRTGETRATSQTLTYVTPANDVAAGTGLIFMPEQQVYEFTNAPYTLYVSPTVGAVAPFSNGQIVGPPTPRDLKPLYKLGRPVVPVTGTFSGTWYTNGVNVAFQAADPDDVAAACSVANLGATGKRAQPGQVIVRPWAKVAPGARVPKSFRRLGRP